jgi:hypothetical protein
LFRFNNAQILKNEKKQKEHKIVIVLVGPQPNKLPGARRWGAALPGRRPARHIGTPSAIPMFKFI